MCTYSTEKVALERSSGKTRDGWATMSEATVYYDHPVHAPDAHTVNIDFLAPERGPGSRIAVELSLDSARELLAALNARPDLRVNLIGHTDATGAPAHNQDLSARRAATVVAWLVQHGVPPSRMQSGGLGASAPIADNATELGRAQNRRVEVKALN